MPLYLTLGGNATVLIRGGAVRVLTDPWLSERAGPWRRLRPCALRPGDLAPLAAILISHAHPDHLDSASLALLPRTTPVVSPEGRPLRKLAEIGFRELHGLKEWEAWSTPGVRVTAVPSIHTRGSLGYLVEIGGRRVYFAGDAGPSTPFAEIGRRGRPVDAALLPVGGSSLAFGPLQRHLTPAAAARAAAAVRPGVAVPIHWGHVRCVPAVLDRFRGTAARFIEAMRVRAPEIAVCSPDEGIEVEVGGEYCDPPKEAFGLQSPCHSKT